jgi:signal transduction histidine kinase/CheY-like chemotaxis protein
LKTILDDGLDELAITAHAGFFPRVGITIAVAAVVASMLPSGVCIAWGGLAVALEISGWFATRRQFLRQPASQRRRLWHIGGLGLSSGAWVVLGALLWQSGSVEGALCGAIVWLALIFFAQSNAFQSPMGFAVGGAAPAVAVLAVVTLGPDVLHLRLAPVVAILCIALIFAGEGVARMLAARRILNQTQSEVRKNASHWKMLFDQSPLPQLFFDASRLHQLVGEKRAGGRSQGERLRLSDPTGKDLLARVNIMSANAAAHGLFGGAQAGQPLAGQFLDANFFLGLSASLDAPLTDGGLAPFETKVRQADGTDVDVRVHIRTVPDPDHPWSKGIATFVDMTQMHRAAEAQRYALAAAEAANTAKSDFLATMSHEIRTPLNGVLGMVQGMERDALSPRQRERLQMIGQSGQSLLMILNDILDLSKIEAGKLELEETDFEVERILANAHGTFKPMAEIKNVGLVLEVDSLARGVFRGDPARVGQIANNLISNALKFTESGLVRVGLGFADGLVTIRVSDTGIGIDAHKVEQLFEKFTQADSSTTRKFGGTGLGLSICKELVRAMGGEISATSEIGVGSCFVVQLPLPKISGARAAPAAAATRPSTPDVYAQPLRILAAEDNAVNQLVLKTLLSQAGIDPHLVGNGEDAVAAWEAGEWDLILMDVQMPVVDGPEAARRIRRREQATGRARTPIIALTANAMSHQQQTYLEAGMDFFVAKPIEVGKLFAAIDTALACAQPDTAKAVGLSR